MKIPWIIHCSNTINLSHLTFPSSGILPLPSMFFNENSIKPNPFIQFKHPPFHPISDIRILNFFFSEGIYSSLHPTKFKTKMPTGKKVSSIVSKNSATFFFNLFLKGNLYKSLTFSFFGIRNRSTEEGGKSKGGSKWALIDLMCRTLPQIEIDDVWGQSWMACFWLKENFWAWLPVVFQARGNEGGDLLAVIMFLAPLCDARSAQADMDLSALQCYPRHITPKVLPPFKC